MLEPLELLPPFDARQSKCRQKMSENFSSTCLEALDASIEAKQHGEAKETLLVLEASFDSKAERTAGSLALTQLNEAV